MKHECFRFLIHVLLYSVSVCLSYLYIGRGEDLDVMLLCFDDRVNWGQIAWFTLLFFQYTSTPLWASIPNSYYGHHSIGFISVYKHATCLANLRSNKLLHDMNYAHHMVDKNWTFHNWPMGCPDSDTVKISKNFSVIECTCHLTQQYIGSIETNSYNRKSKRRLFIEQVIEFRLSIKTQRRCQIN